MNEDAQELLSRGVTEVIDRKHLEEALKSGRKLRVKLGIDPTSPNIHIGRAILLWKLRAFQDLGHTAVFIVGDETAVVGDTSDKDAERPMITKEQVKDNMKTYLDQAFKILDPNKTETHYNSEWLSKLGFIELAQMANLFGLHEFESRENISKRMKAGQRVSFHELLYPLMQGYDSVAIRADVELGGNDQRFNLLTGRRIQPLYNQEPQDIMMTELLEGLDGRKMSSSWGNVVNVTDAPSDMYGKIMSMQDGLIKKYFILCTKVPLNEVEEIMNAHPKEAKMRLAKEIVSLYYGLEASTKAESEFVKAFQEGGIPEEMPEVKAEKGAKLSDVLVGGVVSSKTEWRRLVGEGAVKNAETGATIDSPDATLEEELVLKIGKHRFVRIRL